MPNTPTPGETAYAAFCRTYQAPYDRPLAATGRAGRWQPWAALAPEERHAWEAAAQAVLAWAQAQAPGTAGWLQAHPPPPLSAAQQAALDVTLEAFGEEEEPHA